jgi:hypothetical protein
MKAGDAFFCTQRLAHLLARNTKADPTMFVFFEISHVDHPVLKDPALQSMWLEYKNVAHYLGDENAGIILHPTEVIAQPEERDLIDLAPPAVAYATAAQPSSPYAYPPIAPIPPPPGSSSSSSFQQPPIVRQVSENVAVTTLSPSGNRRNQQQQLAASGDIHPEAAVNPMFANNPPISSSGYASVTTVDNHDDSLPRPSNNIEMSDFSSAKHSNSNNNNNAKK